MDFRDLFLFASLDQLAAMFAKVSLEYFQNLHDVVKDVYFEQQR